MPVALYPGKDPQPLEGRTAMKNTLITLATLLLSGTSLAYAAPDGSAGGGSFLGYLFLGFFALIIVSQVVPACLLGYGMIKGVFSSREDHAAEQGN
jgi:hypothetical protein